MLVRIAKSLIRNLRGGAVILAYHRIAEVQSDPWGLCVSPTRFSEQLQALSQYCTCLTVGELVRRLNVGRLPRRTVAVTFDDGYADNLFAAKPLLEKYAVPATFYLSPGLLDGRTEFWWDELERIILAPGSLLSDLVLNVAGQRYSRRGSRALDLSVEDHRLHRNWHWSAPPPTPRHSLYLELWSMLKPLTRPNQCTVLAQLSQWARGSSIGRESHRPMSRQEAASLGAGGLVEIGAHTMTHPTLPSLPSEAQRQEIQLSREQCSTIWGKPVASFSYPYGDLGTGSMDLVREGGFSSACIVGSGRIYRCSARYALPRLPVREWSGEDLLKRSGLG